MVKRRSGEAGPEIPSMTARVLELSAPQVAWGEGAGTSIVVVKQRVRRAAEEIERAAEAGSGPVRRRKRPALPTAEQAPRRSSVRIPVRPNDLYPIDCVMSRYDGESTGGFWIEILGGDLSGSGNVLLAPIVRDIRSLLRERRVPDHFLKKGLEGGGLRRRQRALVQLHVVRVLELCAEGSRLQSARPKVGQESSKSKSRRLAHGVTPLRNKT